MPILFNFHILLTTFYTIFGTNILIQCPVSVPVCCMFLVSQNIHIKRNPNGIKTDGEYFWNIWEIWEEEAPDPRGPLVRRLLLFFGRKKANFWKKIWAKVSIQSELRISGNLRNGERAESKNAETERQIQSRRGSRPSHAMETMDQRGNPSPT